MKVLCCHLASENETSAARIVLLNSYIIDDAVVGACCRRQCWRYWRKQCWRKRQRAKVSSLMAIPGNLIRARDSRLTSPPLNVLFISKWVSSIRFFVTLAQESYRSESPSDTRSRIWYQKLARVSCKINFDASQNTMCGLIGRLVIKFLMQEKTCAVLRYRFLVGLPYSWAMSPPLDFFITSGGHHLCRSLIGRYGWVVDCLHIWYLVSRCWMLGE